jgi:hypothetical protein
MTRAIMAASVRVDDLDAREFHVAAGILDEHELHVIADCQAGGPHVLRQR